MADALNLLPVHVKHKKIIGNVNGKPVWEVLTTGGLYMNILGKGASLELIGTGPHQALAQHIAQQKVPNIVWTDLSKSDWVDPIDYMYLVPKYVAVTNSLAERFRKLQEE